MPHTVLKRQLESLYDVFRFYHKSIDKVCELKKQDFGDHMAEIWDCYLPISQHFGNTHSLTFGIVPSLDLPKSAGSLFLQASQILQRCQIKPGVMAGCILCRNQVLCTQLPTAIVRHLCFISSTHPKLPAERIPTSSCKLPEGVTCVDVYLTQGEVQEILALKSNEHAYKLASRHVSSFLSDNLRDPNESSVSGKYYTASSSESEPSHLLKHSAKCKTTEKVRRTSSLNKLGDSADHSCIIRLAKSECSFSPESQFTPSDTSVPRSYTENRFDLAQSETVVEERCTDDAAPIDVSPYHGTSGIGDSKDPAVGIAASCGSTPCDVEDSVVEHNVGDDLHKFTLYIQGHSNTQLILLMDESASANPTIVNYLGNVGLSSLVDLEIEVDSCMERVPRKGSPSNYLYVQHDHMWSTFKGDLSSPVPSSAAEQLFSRTAQLMHEVFLEDHSVQELSLRFGHSVVYGHYLGSLETHFQQLVHTSAAGHNISDTIAKIGDRAKKALEEDHRIVLL